jgi:hypothetical protein
MTLFCKVMLPRIPNRYFPNQEDPLNPLPRGRPAADDSARMRRLIDEDDRDSPFWKWIFVAGWLVVAAFGILTAMGWPGTGLILVPIGLGMIIPGGIQLLLNRIS